MPVIQPCPLARARAPSSMVYGAYVGSGSHRQGHAALTQSGSPRQLRFLSKHNLCTRRTSHAHHIFAYIRPEPYRSAAGELPPNHRMWPLQLTRRPPRTSFRPGFPQHRHRPTQLRRLSSCRWRPLDRHRRRSVSTHTSHVTRPCLAGGLRPARTCHSSRRRRGDDAPRLRIHGHCLLNYAISQSCSMLYSAHTSRPSARRLAARGPPLGGCCGGGSGGGRRPR